MDVKYIRADIQHDNGNKAFDVTLKVYKDGYFSCGGLYFDRYTGVSDGHVAGRGARIILSTVRTDDVKPAEFAPFSIVAKLKWVNLGHQELVEFRETKSMLITKGGRKYNKLTGEPIGRHIRQSIILLDSLRSVNLSYGIRDEGKRNQRSC